MEWYPKYPLKYAADTLHLSLAEHGAYNLLIDWYMAHEHPIPDDNKTIAKILGCELDEWIRISAKIVPLFVRADSQLKHKRCERELSEQTQQKKRWSKWQRDSRARKALKKQTSHHTDSQEMSSDIQDRTRQYSTTAKAVVAPTEKWQETYSWIERFLNLGKPLNGSPIHKWLSGGADLELDIKPTVTRLLAAKNGQGPPTSLNYFTAAIGEAVAERKSPMPKKKLEVYIP